MAQKTAVQCLIDELRSGKYLQFEMTKCGHIIKVHNNILDKILQMEKEQIMKAIDRGFDEGCKFPEDISLKNGEQYYNETFGNK